MTSMEINSIGALTVAINYCQCISNVSPRDVNSDFSGGLRPKSMSHQTKTTIVTQMRSAGIDDTSPSKNICVSCRFWFYTGIIDFLFLAVLIDVVISCPIVGLGCIIFRLHFDLNLLQKSSDILQYYQRYVLHFISMQSEKNIYKRTTPCCAMPWCAMLCYSIICYACLVHWPTLSSGMIDEACVVSRCVRSKSDNSNKDFARLNSTLATVL